MTLTRKDIDKCLQEMFSDEGIDKCLKDLWSDATPKREGLTWIVDKILSIVELNLDMSSSIEEFGDKFSNCQDTMEDSNMSIFIQEMDNVLFELDLTEERVHEMLILMNNIRELCKRYDYDLTSHKFDKTYDQLESIMRSKGFVV